MPSQSNQEAPRQNSQSWKLYRKRQVALRTRNRRTGCRAYSVRQPEWFLLFLTSEPQRTSTRSTGCALAGALLEPGLRPQTREITGFARRKRGTFASGSPAGTACEASRPEGCYFRPQPLITRTLTIGHSSRSFGTKTRWPVQDVIGHHGLNACRKRAEVRKGRLGRTGGGDRNTGVAQCGFAPAQVVALSSIRRTSGTTVPPGIQALA